MNKRIPYPEGTVWPWVILVLGFGLLLWGMNQ